MSVPPRSYFDWIGLLTLILVIVILVLVLGDVHFD